MVNHALFTNKKATEENANVTEEILEIQENILRNSGGMI